MGKQHSNSPPKAGRSLRETWIDPLWLCGLGLASLLLFTLDLGGVALRDWDEGIVATVAQEIWRSQTEQNPGASSNLPWLYPTLGGSPYFNKPTLMHTLIAQLYAVWGVNEWTSRLPGALLSSFSVPLLYAIGRELFAKRVPAIFAALVLLNLLPVVRHGRLAMLDGALVTFYLAMLYCVVRSRRDLRWGLGIGIGIGLMGLTKGVIGFLLAAIALLFVLWDTPRLLTSVYLWSGIAIGLAPLIAWYWAQWQRYGSLFLGVNLVNQSFNRLTTSVESNSGPVWYYLLELLKYSLPWLIFVPQGLRSAWENRNLGWAKLAIVWCSVYLGVISVMQTKLPWYVMPLYPGLALVVGAFLAELWNPGDVLGIRDSPRRQFPAFWWGLLGLVAIAGWGLTLYCLGIGTAPKPDLVAIFGSLALTLTVAAILVWRRDSQFILVLFWGSYVSLIMLLVSPVWLWELQDSYPVKPVAALIRQHTPPGIDLWTSYPYSRPSLNFYSDRQIKPASSPADLIRYWQATPTPYLLLDHASLNLPALLPLQILGEEEGWFLVTRPQRKK